MPPANGLPLPFASNVKNGEFLTKRDTAKSSPKSTALGSNVEMVVPTTLTVSTTLIQTTWVTITSEIFLPTPTSHTFSGSVRAHKNFPSIGKHLDSSLPKIVTSASSASSSITRTKLLTKTTSHNVRSTTTANSVKASPSASAISNAQKHAIIGGLSGVIAGLVLIGVLLCFYYRRRRARHGGSVLGSNDSGIRETISRSWSQLTGGSRRSTRSTPPVSTANTAPERTPPMSRGSSTGGFNGSILRVSMGQWARPFAHNESFRESAGPGRLVVMNPDAASRATTPAPRGSTESSGTYLKRQRSAIRSARVSVGNHSRASSYAASHHRNRNLASHLDEPPLPTGWMSLTRPTASLRSSSVSSLPTIQHQPPEDPFLTPPEGSIEESRPRTERAALATLQTVAGAAGRSLSHLGQTLNRFRSRSNTIENDVTPRHSNATFSSDGDPFRLDSPTYGEGGVYSQGNVLKEAEAIHTRPWRGT